MTNVVILSGNLATEPELRTTNGGKSVCSFRLAVSRMKSDEADFFTIVAFEKQGELCEQYLSIGRQVLVEGRLHHSTWTAGDGSPRSKVEVIAQRVEFIGPRKDSTPAADTTSEGTEFVPVGAGAASDDDIPF